jgi:small subunit ribosomal protein S8
MSLLQSRGLINDSISDMLTRIRNSILTQKSTVQIPFTKLNLEVIKILEKEGFIQSYYFELNSNLNFENKNSSSKLDENSSFSVSESMCSNNIVVRLKYNSKKLYKGKTKQSCITNLRRLSKPGLRIYVNSREIPRILNGTGIAIISTSNGLMTDSEARAKKLGGELLCSIW